MQPYSRAFRHVGLAHLSRWVIGVNFYNLFWLQVARRLKGWASWLKGPITVDFFFNHFQRCIVELVNLEILEKWKYTEFYLLSVSFLLNTRLRIRSSRATFSNTGATTPWCPRNYFYRLHCFYLVQNVPTKKPNHKNIELFPRSVFDRSALILLTRSFLAIISSWFRMSTCRLRSISRARNVIISSFLNFYTFLYNCLCK